METVGHGVWIRDGGQKASLEKIEQKFDSLAQELKKTRFVFNTSSLGEGFKGVEDELAHILGAKWPEHKEQMVSQLNVAPGKENLTPQQATEFLAEVHCRANGEMPDVIRSVLLSTHPRYANNPALEVVEGWKQTFRTKDHPKANGVDFSISFPASWNRREGNRPNIIQVFRSGSGHGPIACNLMVNEGHGP